MRRKRILSTRKCLRHRADSGQTPKKSPTSETFFNRLVGHSNKSRILFCGVETQALIDSRPNFTTVSGEFYRTLLPRPKLLPLATFNLKVQCAGGNNLSYTGCIEAVIEVPFLPNIELAIPVLVVPATEYSSQVPIVIGTNMIRECRKL